MGVEFELPNTAQCKQWWTEHARQLTAPELFALGCLSSAVRLSFRDMRRIADLMVKLDARRQKAGGDPGQVGLSGYVSAILWGTSLPLPSTPLSTVKEVIWSVDSVLYICDRLRLPD